MYSRITALWPAVLCLATLTVTSCGAKDTSKLPAAPQPPATEHQATASKHSAAQPGRKNEKPKAKASLTKANASVQQKTQAAADSSDPVVKTIADAEKAYRSGQGNYKAGHLDAAKDDFNRAVDVLMEGPVDIKADARLQQEFDKITEEINKLEMVAFQQGDGFTEEQPEPAPIDEANGVTFPADPNMKATAEAELKTTRSDLPLMINDYVAGYINYFSTRGRGTFERSLERSGRYRDMIERIFKEEGVPQDLIYLAQAESGFHPLALSRVGARGMWQFMSSRGKGYGLTRDRWVDDRQDPERATRAAARHLKDLYNEFGDWYLAMAAYNSGPGNVQQAVRRTGYADFWELYKRNVLPAETKNYVPIILAMTIMSKNPAQYGLQDVQLDPPEKYDVVRVDYPVDLRLVAECVDAQLDDLVELNPSLIRRTTPRNHAFDLRLPAGTRDKYETAIAAIPRDKRVQWRYHKVETGETLAGIARKYRTPPHSISLVNHLESAKLQPDTRLVIPIPANVRIVYSRYPSRYRVRPGDTAYSVASDFGVPVAKLRRWNGLKGNGLRRGRILLIYKPVPPGETDHSVALKSHKKRHPVAAKAKASHSAGETGKEAISARNR